MSDQKVTGNFPTLEQLALSQLRERFPPSFTLLAKPFLDVRFTPLLASPP